MHKKSVAPFEFRGDFALQQRFYVLRERVRFALGV